jgi:hypothetical protein
MGFLPPNLTVLVLLCGLLLTGCDQKALLQKFIPKDDDAFARRFIEAVRTGDRATSEQMLDTTLRNEEAANGLRELSGLLARGGAPISMEPIGCDVVNQGFGAAASRKTNLSYQIHFHDGWMVGNVYLERKPGSCLVLASRFSPVPNSLEVLNRFTFRGKSYLHFTVLALCITVPCLVLFALVVCIRSRLPRKWLWIVFILFGVCQFRLDWTSGAYEFRPISVSLFGTSLFKVGPYAPWILSCAVPLGAIVFLIRRRRLISED